MWIDINTFINSPELKAQVSFADHLSSVVCLSVCPPIKFSHFHLLLQNHWANFNQTWYMAYLGKVDSILFKWRSTSFSKGRELWNSKNTLKTLKNLLLQNHWSNFSQTWHKTFLGEWNSSLLKWRAIPFLKERQLGNNITTLRTFKNLLLQKHLGNFRVLLINCWVFYERYSVFPTMATQSEWFESTNAARQYYVMHNLII